MLKVIARSCNRVPVTVLVRGTAFLDLILQAFAQIFALPPLGNLGLIIKLYLIDQQAGKAARLFVDLLIVR